MNSFWICLICQGSNVKTAYAETESIMRVVEIDQVKVLCPTDEVQDENINISFDTLVMIPDRCGLGQIQTLSNFSTNIYTVDAPTSKFLTRLYKIRKSKFSERQKFTDLYDCEDVNHTTRKCSSMKPIVDDSMIRGSASWKHQQRKLINSLFSQYGNMAIGFNIDIPMNSQETKATALICERRVITIEYNGDVNDEYQGRLQTKKKGYSTSLLTFCRVFQIIHSIF